MKNLKLFALAAITQVTLSGCDSVSEPVVKAPIVTTYTIPNTPTQDVQSFPAVIQSADLTQLSFRVSGEIVELPIKNGQQVKKGELLAKLDATNFELALKDRKAKLDLAKLSTQRAKAMVDKGNIASSTYDEVEAQYRIELAQYQLAKAQLSYVTLNAPFDGIVASVNTENFQNAHAGQAIITMHKANIVEVKVAMPDAILAFASTNKTEKSAIVLDVALDAYPEHLFKAQYKEHTTEQNSESQTYTLILAMPIDNEKVALQGMPGSVKIDMAKIQRSYAGAFRVPIEAVVLPDSLLLNAHERVVWRVKADQTVEAVKVATKVVEGIAAIEVRGDLNAGDHIVTHGLQYLADGLAVRVVAQGENRS